MASRLLWDKTSSSLSACCCSAVRSSPCSRMSLRRHTLELDEAFSLASIRGAGRRCRPPHRAGYPQRPGNRCAHRVGLPDGVATTGAAKNDSIANMHLRLPVVVIGVRPHGDRYRYRGAGLLPLQVDKFLRRYESLCTQDTERKCGPPGPCPTAVADEFLAHARAIRAERAKAADAGRSRACWIAESWGGVTRPIVNGY